MKRTIIISSLSILLVAAAATVLAVAPREWIHLGDRTVTDRADHDVFEIKGQKRELRALKLKVKERPVEIRKIKIHFANGTTQKHTVRRVVPAGGETRVIDLVGKERIVTRVEFWYDAQSAGRKAVVRLFGLR